MNDMEKLRRLIEHWAEHNEEHVKTYREWADRAEALKRDDIAEVLRRIASQTEKLDELFKRSKSLLSKGS